MPDSLSLPELPIDVDNEALILSNALKNTKNRELFIRKTDFLDFRYKENQVIAWAIKAVSDLNMDVNTDAVLLKSKSCPVRYNVDFTFIDGLLQNFPEVSTVNFDNHISKLQLDKIKSELMTTFHKSIYTACLNPRSDLNFLASRMKNVNDILQKGYSYSQVQFKDMKQVVDEYREYRKHSQGFYTTGFAQLDAYLTEGYKPKSICIVAGLPGMGKCFAPDTGILMFDGSIKKVQDINIDDEVMGPDSKPRKVLSLHRGFDEMYEIKQRKGESYTVNKEHLLHLRCGKHYSTNFPKNSFINISVKDFIKKAKGWREAVTGYRVPVDFSDTQLDFDPYMLGVWLGDGTSSYSDITSADSIIIDYCKEYAEKLGLALTIRSVDQKTSSISFVQRNGSRRKNGNYFLKFLRDSNLLNNKHIPDRFKFTGRENRLQLLAGLLDTDGCLNEKKGGKKRATTFDITSKREILAKDITYLARSLGFYAYYRPVIDEIKSLGFKGLYYSVSISGNTELIPCKLTRKQADPRIEKYSSLVSRIEVLPKGIGPYFGFQVEGDGLFLLHDFTVVHNSSYTLSSINNLANQGVYSAQFALEMDNNALASKLASYHTRISVEKIVKHYASLTDEEKALLEYELDRLTKNKYMRFNDTPTQTLDTIREQIMVLQDHLKQEYLVVSIDLFGKIKEFQDSDNFASDYEKKLNQVQIMAKETGVCIVPVAQIHRLDSSRKFKRPKMSDLKNSGAWEEVADLILAVHRPWYDPETAMKKQIAENEYRYGTGQEPEEEEEDPNESIAEVIILKQRMGEGNKIINFYFDKVTTRYSAITPEFQDALNAEKSFDEEEIPI
jgi:replicative DNA helicase